jgi:tricorn protease-like protein
MANASNKPLPLGLGYRVYDVCSTFFLARADAVHANTLLFTFEGDLWSVNNHGGVASRLTSNTGIESMPTISPDGETVAFRAQYEGPQRGLHHAHP